MGMWHGVSHKKVENYRWGLKKTGSKWKRPVHVWLGLKKEKKQNGTTEKIQAGNFPKRRKYSDPHMQDEAQTDWQKGDPHTEKSTSDKNQGSGEKSQTIPSKKDCGSLMQMGVKGSKTLILKVLKENSLQVYAQRLSFKGQGKNKDIFQIKKHFATSRHSLKKILNNVFKQTMMIPDRESEMQKVWDAKRKEGNVINKWMNGNDHRQNTTVTRLWGVGKIGTQTPAGGGTWAQPQQHCLLLLFL